MLSLSSKLCLILHVLILKYTLAQEKDPFAEDPNAEVHIGSVKVWMESLAYHVEIKEQLEITNFKVRIESHVNFLYC